MREEGLSRARCGGFFCVPRHDLEMSRSRRKENHDDYAHFLFRKKNRPQLKKRDVFFFL
jgi:hypothetical protein